jgi:hypothetical protein
VTDRTTSAVDDAVGGPGADAVSALVRAADDETAGLLDGTLEPAARARGHRGVMAMVKAAVVCVLHPGSRWYGDDAVVARAGEWLADLEALQAPSGLFSSGDNLASPPDSAFTITDVAAVTSLLRVHGYDRSPAASGHAATERGATAGATSLPGSPAAPLRDLHDRLTAVLAAAAGALLVGGVHTPNHRWELGGALARTGALLGDAALLARARTWLAEGVDVDDDGLYSERSPNYAAYVSNHSLTALADLLDRPDLHEVVHRSLHTQLDLTDDRGNVETVQSRRQDQNGPYPLGPFAGQLRRAAVRHACARCANGARRAAEAPEVDAVDILAQQLTEPDLAGPLPETGADAGLLGAAPDAPARRHFRDARLLLDQRRGGARLTVYGGSDVPATGRIASGLACNPTFLRARLGGTGVESVRLSRDFFGLGPFRASTIDVDGDRVLLREQVSAAYYQPLTGAALDPAGRYALEHEGRFAAAMSFSGRARDVVTLATTVQVDLRDDGADLTVTTDGPATGHALEIALAPGGELTGVEERGDGRYELVEGHARYVQGGQTLVIGPGQGSGPERPPLYRPGEAYTFLGGTDALGGTRLYLTWRSPGTVTVRLRLE